MSDHVFGRRYSFLRTVRVWTLRWNPLFERRGDPWRPITKSLDLLILNEDGVTPDPVVAANREIEDFRIADSTVVGLGVRHQRGLCKVFQLNFHHFDPSPLRGLVIGKRSIDEGPRVPLAPKSI